MNNINSIINNTEKLIVDFDEMFLYLSSYLNRVKKRQANTMHIHLTQQS